MKAKKYKDGGSTGFLRNRRDKRVKRLEARGLEASTEGLRKVKKSQEKEKKARKRKAKAELARTDAGIALKTALADRTARRSRNLESRGKTLLAKGERKSDRSGRIENRLQKRDERRSNKKG